MADFAQLVVQLELQQAQFVKGMNDAAKRLENVNNAAKKTQSGLDGLAKGFKAVQAAAAAGAAAMGAVRVGEAIIRAGDQVKTLEGQFKALTGDGARAADMLQRVFDVAARAGAPLEATGAAMARMTIALGDMGATNQQIADLTENFLKLGAVGGASGAESAAAFQQLGQALAAGKLQGDELRSVMENTPLVARAIAKELGVAVGELKKLGSEGKISAKDIANALLKVTQDVDRQFAQLPKTLEMSLNSTRGAMDKISRGIRQGI